MHAMADTSDGSLFSDDWTGKEELKLLEAIDEYGYGNWEPVSTRVGKSPDECRDHYNTCYMFNPHPILPAISLQPEPTSRRTSPLMSGSSDKRYDSNNPLPVFYDGVEIKGYIPRRGEFIVEPDNSAECIIAHLTPDPDDDMLVKALKLAAVNIYCSRMKRREVKKHIIRDYGLLDIRKQTALDKSRLTKNQLRMKWISRPFMRFMSPQNATKFLISHYLEDDICEEIAKLERYRQNGITTFRGAGLYEKLLSKRHQQKAGEKDNSKQLYRSEESLLYQVLHQGTMRTKKPVARESKPLDITFSAGVELLDKEERELCSSCRFQPLAYLQYKKIVLTEHDKFSKLSLADCRKLLKIDVNKTRKVYNLFVSKDWIVPVLQ